MKITIKKYNADEDQAIIHNVFINGYCIDCYYSSYNKNGVSYFYIDRDKGTLYRGKSEITAFLTLLNNRKDIKRTI